MTVYRKDPRCTCRLTDVGLYSGDCPLHAWGKVRIMEEWPATAADERLLADHDEGMATGAPIGDRVGNWLLGLLGAVLAIELGLLGFLFWWVS